MNIDKSASIASLVISILALIVSISCALFVPEIVEDCSPSTYLQDDEVRKSIDEVKLDDSSS